MRAYLKLHRRPEKWATEVHAYERWVPALGGQAPNLLGLLEGGPWALLLSELSGNPLDRVRLSVTRKREVWRSAGAALRRIHALPAGRWFGMPRRDGGLDAAQRCSDPVVHIESALTNWLERGIAEHALDPQEIAAAQVALEGVEAFAGERPTPCHGDFRPRNWIVGPDGAWRGTVDFEHMRWDLPLTDIGHWWDRIPFSRPDFRAAFVAGYDACLDGPRKTQMQVIRVLAALARIVAGRASGRRDMEAVGRIVLRRLAQNCR